MAKPAGNDPAGLFHVQAVWRLHAWMGIVLIKDILRGNGMKAIVCELCGGNELLKDSGVFVCQHCGTKYTLEEARKLIVEGTVSVNGIAGQDNLLQRAKEFERQGEIDRAIEYYNRVLDLDLDHAEAKAAIERLDKVVDKNNLTVTFLPADSGLTTANVFIDGKLVANIDAGETREFKIPAGKHTVGLGAFKVKNPHTVNVTRRSRYQMRIMARAFSTPHEFVEL